MGLRTQEKWQDFKYASASAVDLSVWPWCKGPEITLLPPGTVDATTGVRAFFELGTTLYCAQGRYVLQRINDGSWTVAKDFGAGVSILNVAVFTSNFDGVQRVFVALSTGPAQYSSNDDVDGDGDVRRAGVRDDREWWADASIASQVRHQRRSDARGQLHQPDLSRRDKSSSISALMVSAAGTLIIAKTDGLYTLDRG